MKSILKVERKDTLLLAVFQIIVGVAHIAVLASSNLAIYTSGILAVLSFTAAYGLLTGKKWSPWLVIALFFPQFAFGVFTLYASILKYTIYEATTFLMLNVALAAFIILSFVAFVYTAAKRKTFQAT